LFPDYFLLSLVPSIYMQIILRVEKSDKNGLLMLTKTEIKRLSKVQDSLIKLCPKPGNTTDRAKNREYCIALREAFHLFEDVVLRFNKAGVEFKGAEFNNLKSLASDAILNLGAVPEPSVFSLKEYDHFLYGPYLGVSDAGGAAHIIRKAAFCSPKYKALGNPQPLEIGVAHDAERLAAVGEVAVGPEEYREIILECHRSILISTNIGTRLNLRYYKIRPTIYVRNGPVKKVVEQSVKEAETLLKPFWHTPDGIPRPVTVFASFSQGKPFTHRLEILKKLNAAFSEDKFCDSRSHKLGLVITVNLGSHGYDKVIDAIELAHNAGISEVAVKGPVRYHAQDKISMPGLMNHFSPTLTKRILSYAARKKIKIGPKNLVDPDTVARNVWTGLQTARNMGLHLGKYGLFPLTLDEASEVMGQVQKYFTNWSAAPVFYLDFSHSKGNKVYSGKNIVEGAKVFLDIVAKHGIPVVLFDTADKDRGRKLVKQSKSDRIGILTPVQIAKVAEYAKKKGIRALWAGGISIPQAFELGKLKLFGIYVTTAAASIRPVTDRYRGDPMITAEKEITFDGVSRTKLLLEAGFLVTRIRELDFKAEADLLEEKATDFIHLISRTKQYDAQDETEKELFDLTSSAWKKHFSQI
jgi:hypothetical protein